MGGWRVFGVLSLAMMAVGRIHAGTPAARVEQGEIAGKTVGSGDVEAFLGIPFARPPAGELRWKPPQPPEKWEGVRRCEDFGPACPQPEAVVQPIRGPRKEDCLYLNVWRPAGAAKKLPVMVWIHGGGFTTGSGAKELYDGSKLARAGAAVVTINYRLGPLGFLAHPALSAEAADGTSGNYGLLDQIAALEWVRANIEALGGDPDRVTIFGESAGAVSVSCLLVSPKAKGLFHRAIIQSGTADGIRTPLKAKGDGPSAEKAGLAVAAELGVEGEGPEALAKLRAKTAEEILAASDPRVGLFGKGTKFRPCVDGVVLPAAPLDLIRAGRHNDVPVIIGSNADEGTLFTKLQLRIRRPAGYRFLLGKAFGGRAGQVEAMYPVGRGKSVEEQVAAVITHSAFTAPARRTARVLASKGRSPVYLYYFSRVGPGMKRSGMGATHGAEIFYLFGTPPRPSHFDETDRDLAGKMRDSWVRFARTGDPNGRGIPRWRSFAAGEEAHLEFGDRIRPGTDLHKDECDLFDRVGDWGS